MHDIKKCYIIVVQQDKGNVALNWFSSSLETYLTDYNSLYKDNMLCMACISHKIRKKFPYIYIAN